MNKTLTIVVPTYNMDRYLERCLSSLIISQEQMDKLEVLVINDGSKDHSSEIGHSFEKKYPQTFRVIDKENGNYGSCINRGLGEAKGKYIKILDADDFFDDKNFPDFIKLLGELDADCVMSDMVKIDDDNNQWGLCNYSLPADRIFSISEFLKPIEPLWMHCVAYKTEKLRNIEYHQTEGISYTDQEWLFLPMSVCNTFYYYPRRIYNYLIGRTGQTMDPVVFRKNFWMEIQGLTVMLNEFKCFLNKGDSYYYLEKRLFIRSNFIYGVFFLTYKMGICYEKMVELDMLLKEVSPIVYNKMNDLYRFKPIKYHFVRDWRNKNRPRSLWVLKIGLYISSIIKKENNNLLR